MALSGTLKDFGIADILQLIGHQTKTGKLVLKNGPEEVDVLFVEGNVVFATDNSRPKESLLGNMLLRAEILSEEKLEEALVVQRRSLKRLGDVLLEHNYLAADDLAQIMRLQTTETLYKLFSWKSGTYEFEQEELEGFKSGFEPVRAESVLLEGFRRMDEWPTVRKKLPWPDATFTKQKDLPDAVPDARERDGEPGERHRKIYRLAVEGRPASNIADVSRAGEFETWKALVELCDWGYLEAVRPAGKTEAIAAARKPARSGGLVRLAVATAAFCATILLVHLAIPALGAARGEQSAGRGAVLRLLAQDQILRLESALEVYRVEHGEYPASLAALVDGQLVTARDVSYPFRDPYQYRRTPQGFVLLPPLD
ncbi:MAG: DUF4388 domain-containing protein [Myxococcales bacterium]